MSLNGSRMIRSRQYPEQIPRTRRAKKPAERYWSIAKLIQISPERLKFKKNERYIALKRDYKKDE